jgi:membrane associated rhomboid family serine protease
MAVKGRYSKDITIDNITSMFVHASYNHLFGNLAGMVICGHRVYRYFPGIPVFYLTFLCGGICGSTEFGFNILKRAFLFSEKRDDYLLSEIFRQGRAMVKQITDKILDSRCYSIGSSGGVYALLGCGFVLDLKWILQQMKTLKGFSRKILHGASYWKLFMVACYQCIPLSFIHGEFEAAYEDVNNVSFIQWIFSRHINHAAHVIGFGFGATAAVILSMMTRKPTPKIMNNNLQKKLIRHLLRKKK